MQRVTSIPYTTVCNILRRESRFVVEVLVNGSKERAYINNTGRLTEILTANRIGYCMKSKGTRTKYRLFAVKEDDLAALIDTRIQEEVFRILIEEKMLPWLGNCSIIKRAPRLGESVLDYLIRCDKRMIYVELKSAVLRGNREYAMYPDCPSLRGRRHIKELINHTRQGGLGLIVFIAALPYVKYFTPNKNADPVIAQLLKEAVEEGVMVKAINIVYSPLKQHVYLVNEDLLVIL